MERMSKKMHSKDIQVMHDIETMSQKKTAAILSIGAVKFNANEIVDTFYVNISPASCKEVGLSIDKETVEWWMQQRPEAFAAFKKDRVSIHDALHMYAEWYGKKSCPTWGNGIDFDNVILENAFQVCDIKIPWKFYDGRCFRTVKNLFNIQLPKHDGVLHNALDDAISQTKSLQQILKGAL